MTRNELALSTEDRSSFEKALRFALGRVERNRTVYTDRFPAPASVDLIYPAIPNEDWTAGFWTGMLWLAYELTGDAAYRKAAEYQLRSYERRIDERIAIQTHDLGFLYSLSAVACYRLTGSERAKATALKAADVLTERYSPTAGVIQAWGDLGDPEQRGRMIIDCLMNLPLLYWAAEATGDTRYAEMAAKHAEQSAAYLVRPDRTTYHTYYMDVDTGEPKYGNTHQGYADDSCWARGQAWGIYGFALSYAYTGSEAFLKTACDVADYFLSMLPEDGVVYWDLTFTEGREQERDSSAAAIACCGLLELANRLPSYDPAASAYRAAALRMLHSLGERYTTREMPHADGILMHAVYNKPRGWGVDESTIWGDYFYLEALARVLRDGRTYW